MALSDAAAAAVLLLVGQLVVLTDFRIEKRACIEMAQAPSLGGYIPTVMMIHQRMMKQKKSI